MGTGSENSLGAAGPKQKILAGRRKNFLGGLAANTFGGVRNAFPFGPETDAAVDGVNLAPEAERVADHRFVSSDAPEQFLRLGQRFLGAAIERVEARTLG